MAEDEPRWYYVGNGQLRYKFGDFWTDQYKTIGHSERAVPTASIESLVAVCTAARRAFKSCFAASGL